MGVDVWSLGCILAELSSGYVLFQVWGVRGLPGSEGPALLGSRGGNGKC